jgi:small acid-soluble spore protein H (minor)
VNSQRALEIMESPEMIHVTYQGTPIYIQNVNPDEGTARIYPLNDTEYESEVPVSQLEEQ